MKKSSIKDAVEPLLAISLSGRIAPLRKIHGSHVKIYSIAKNLSEFLKPTTRESWRPTPTRRRRRKNRKYPRLRN